MSGGPADSYTAVINGPQVQTPSGISVHDAPVRRRPTPWRRATPWFLAALVVVAIGLPTAAAASHVIRVAPPVGYAHPLVNETLVNLTDTPAYSPAYLSTPQNSTLELHLVNVGMYTHTFTLSKIPNHPLNTSWTPTELDAFFNANGSLANLSVPAGGSVWTNLTFNATNSAGFDSFEFVSVVPYQFQAGMRGFLNITSTAPGLGLEENTSVQGSSYLFIPDVLDANSSHFPVNVDVLVTNLGDFAHTFTVVPQSNVSLTPGNYSSYFLTHPPLVSVNVPTGDGATVWANFTVPASGVYEYLCQVSGHFAAGMFGYLYAGVPVPPAPPAPSTAIVEGWVLIGSGILLGIGIGVAALASFVGRFPPAPPSGHGGHP